MSVLFWIFAVAIAAQCGYALYFFSRIVPVKSNPHTPFSSFATIPVSIIICAKNEAQHLEQNLPEILQQRYRNAAGVRLFEVVVVNDASDDDTQIILHNLQKSFDHLQVVNIAHTAFRSAPGKKYALQCGIEKASHNYLLMTDADCLPASENWLAAMAAPFETGKEIVAGFSGFAKENGMLNAFIRWETMHTFLQFSTYAFAGKPYMAVGRNLACTKACFHKAQLHPAWSQLPSGDDDLLVQAAATKNNFAIVAHTDAFTFSPPQKIWKSWLFQKQRHASTGKYYAESTKLLLGGYALSHGLSWLLFFVGLWFESWGLVLLLMLLRCALYWTIWNVTSHKLRIKNLLRWMPLCDWGWSAYNCVLMPYLLWKNKNQWK